MTATIYKSDIHDASAGAVDTPVFVGGEALNMLSGTTYEFWKPDAIGDNTCTASFDLGSAINVNFLCFDGHNLDSIDYDRIELSGSNDPTFFSSTLLKQVVKSSVIPGANIHEFISGSNYRYFRLTIIELSNFLENPIVCVLYVGQKLDLPKGIKPSYTPPRLGVVSEVLNNTSDGGNFIGRSTKRKNYDFVIKNDLVLKTWIDTNWLTLLDYILEKPFFYSWNDVYPEEGVFCWTDGNIAPPRFTDQVNLSFSFRCSGFL